MIGIWEFRVIDFEEEDLKEEGGRKVGGRRSAKTMVGSTRNTNRRTKHEEHLPFVYVNQVFV